MLREELVGLYVVSDLEAGFGLFIQPFERVNIFGAAAGKVRVVPFVFLSVLLSLAALAFLSHEVDLAFGRVQHDGEDLQVAQQPCLAEARAFTAFAYQQLHEASDVHSLQGLLAAMLLSKHTYTNTHIHTPYFLLSLSPRCIPFLQKR